MLKLSYDATKAWQRYGKILSRRELQALEGIGRGWTQKVIGQQLGGLDKSTVNTYVCRAMEKLDVLNRVELSLKLVLDGVLMVVEASEVGKEVRSAV